MSDAPSDARRAYLLAIADDELVIGHRHCFWTALAPSMEEDLAFATIAQDEINHADVWYQVLAGADREAVDALGLGREPGEYRHAVLCERAPGDFADALARHFLYDHFDTVRLAALSESADLEIAAVASKLAHEERYHLLHADQWLERLGRGGGEPAQRLHDALNRAWDDALWLFEPTPGEEQLVEAGIVPVPAAELVGRWAAAIAQPLGEAGYGDVVAGLEAAPDGDGRRLPEGLLDRPGGRQGVHSADWTDDAWLEMTALHRTHPRARW